MKEKSDFGRDSFTRRDFLKFSGFCGGMMVLGEWGNGTPSIAAEAYPSKKITWIVGHVPGGGEDMTVRVIAPFIEKYLKMASPSPNKVELLVKNLVGGGPLRSLYALYNSNPDGYTIASGSEALLSGEALGELKLDFNLMDMTFLARLASGNKVLVTHNKSDLYTWEDVVRASKKSPIRIGSGVFGASNHVGSILLIDTTQLSAKMVFAKGTSETNAALIRGDIPLAMHSFDSVRNLIEIKEFRPILTFSEAIKHPGVQNVKDIGFPELNEVLNSQRFVIAPPKLPKDIKKILEDAVRKAVVDKEFLEFNKKAGISYYPVIGSDFDSLIRNIMGFYKSKEKVLRKYLAEKEAS